MEFSVVRKAAAALSEGRHCFAYRSVASRQKTRSVLYAVYGTQTLMVLPFPVSESHAVLNRDVMNSSDISLTVLPPPHGEVKAMGTPRRYFRALVWHVLGTCPLPTLDFDSHEQVHRSSRSGASRKVG